jgi:heme-degrading monooxygenase HmoA
MVLEVAILSVQDGAQPAFEAAYQQARALVAATPGWQSMRMTRGVETPTRYVLLVEWDSVAAHEDFRSSERFGQWRALIGPHFAGPPVVEHFTDV